MFVYRQGIYDTLINASLESTIHKRNPDKRGYITDITCVSKTQVMIFASLQIVACASVTPDKRANATKKDYAAA